jgi:oxalate decarboxylase
MEMTRREIIQSLAAVGVAAAVSSTANASLASTERPLTVAITNSTEPQPIEGGLGATDPGPRNVTLDLLNPDMLTPPPTDAGDMPNLKFSFSSVPMRLTDGGWARQVTQVDLPIATSIAGVDMRLKPGAIRELHWHPTAEWAYMLNGTAQVTCLDPQGRNFVGNVGAGDLWYFPTGYPHSIQALNEGCEFLLVFDKGNFSENDTFLLSDWFAHTPKGVLAKNFGVPQSDFQYLPSPSQRYIYPGIVPGPPSVAQVSDPYGPSPQSFTYHMLAQPPIQTQKGTVRIVDSSSFHVSKTIAAVLQDIEPGGIREMHWHPNADEWQYYIEGNGRMTVFGAEGRARTYDYQAGDVGYAPSNMGHYIENTGDTTLRFLALFKTDHFAEISLAQWMAVTPPELVQGDLNLPREVMNALPKKKPFIV